MSSSLPTLIKSTSWSPDEVKLLKETYFKGLSDTEIALAHKQCVNSNLNPFKKEIYAYKIGGRLALVPGIAGYRKIAHASGSYLGCKVSVLEDKDGKIVSATATVKKLVKNHVAEFEATLRADEFLNDINPNHKDRPENQIRIRAEAAALKMGFSEVDAIADETNIDAVTGTEVIEVDVMPTHEHESQEVSQVLEPKNLTPETDPGEQMIKFKRGTKKIKEFKQDELIEFVTWAYKQERLAPAVQLSLANVEAYLKGLE